MSLSVIKGKLGGSTQPAIAFRKERSTCFDTFPFPPGVLDATGDLPGELAAIADAAKELNELREGWLNPPEWTREEIMTFAGTVGGPWHRYIDPDILERLLALNQAASG